MLRPIAAFFLAFAVLLGCGSGMRNKDKVQAAIVERLKKSSGLDLANLDVNTTAVNFDKNLAYATVAFHPKGDASINSGMVMKYTLEQRDGKWVVVKVGDSQGRGMSGHATGNPSNLPAGHPPLDGAGSAGVGSMSNPHASGTGQERPNGQVR